jgi:hypothetical protein
MLTYADGCVPARSQGVEVGSALSKNVTGFFRVDSFSFSRNAFFEELLMPLACEE